MLSFLLHDQLTILRSYNYVRLVTCNHVSCDPNLSQQSVIKMEPGINLGIVVAAYSVNYCDNRLGGPSNFMWRRSEVMGVAYNSENRYLSDFDFAIRILQKGYLANTDTPGYLYRRHSNSDTNLFCDTEIQTLEWAKMYLDWGGSSYCAAKQLLSGVHDAEIEKKLRHVMKHSFRMKSRLKGELLWILKKITGTDWREFRRR